MRFFCNDMKEIDPSRFLDGSADCTDGSDESYASWMSVTCARFSSCASTSTTYSSTYSTTTYSTSTYSSTTSSESYSPWEMFAASLGCSIGALLLNKLAIFLWNCCNGQWISNFLNTNPIFSNTFNKEIEVVKEHEKNVEDDLELSAIKPNRILHHQPQLASTPDISKKLEGSTHTITLQRSSRPNHSENSFSCYLRPSGPTEYDIEKDEEYEDDESTQYYY